MINYVIGDATNPQGNGPKLITHVCNNVGAWGAGFVMALSAKWRAPEEYYLWWARRSSLGYMPFELGQVQYVNVESGNNPMADPIWVANMVAQNGVRQFKNPRPLDYDALQQCLTNVGQNARKYGYSVHMPRIGCGLAGGEWGKVEYIIEHTLVDVPVTVYDLD